MSASKPLPWLQSVLAGGGVQPGQRIPCQPSGPLSREQTLATSRTWPERHGHRTPAVFAAAPGPWPRAGLWPPALAVGLGLLCSVLAALPVRAGSATAESVWDRRNARARALEQVPRGAVITREACLEIGMRGNEERYRCTLWYAMPPTDAPQPTEPQP